MSMRVIVVGLAAVAVTVAAGWLVARRRRRATPAT